MTGTAELSNPGARQSHPGDRRSIAWLSGRSGIAFACTVALTRIGTGLLAAHVALGIFQRGPFAAGGDTWGDSFLRWDSGWYLGIAIDGYRSARATVFFPGYPLAVRFVHFLAGGTMSLDQAGLAVSWTAFVAATVLLAEVVAMMASPRVTRLAVTLFAFGPASVFLLAAYPEGCIALLSALVLLLLQRDRFLAAAVAAGAASAVSPFGVCLAACVVVASFRRSCLIRSAAAGVTAVWGLLAWMVWLGVAFHRPFLFSTEQATFNRHLAVPFLDLAQLLRHVADSPVPAGFTRTNWNDTRDINLAFACLALVMLVYFVVAIIAPRFRRWPIYFSVYAALAFVVPGLSVQRFSGVANPEALTRLTSSDLGLYPALGVLLDRRPLLEYPVLAVWIMTAFMVQTVFVLGWYFT